MRLRIRPVDRDACRRLIAALAYGLTTSVADAGQGAVHRAAVQESWREAPCQEK